MVACRDRPQGKCCFSSSSALFCCSAESDRYYVHNSFFQWLLNLRRPSESGRLFCLDVFLTTLPCVLFLCHFCFPAAQCGEDREVLFGGVHEHASTGTGREVDVGAFQGIVNSTKNMVVSQLECGVQP